MGSFLLRFGKFSQLAIVVAGLLAVFLLYATVGMRSPEQSLLFSNLVDFAILLWAVYCTIRCARQCSGQARQLWLLLGAALSVESVAQALSTYYQSFVHASSKVPWPSDVLFFLWVGPAIMMLFPRIEKESGRLDPKRILDFSQIGIVLLTAYLYFFYVPARWEAEGTRVVQQVLQVYIARDALLASAFLMRSVSTSSSSIRTFFRMMTVFFLAMSASDVIYLLTLDKFAGGATWPDLVWAVPNLFVAVTAATWKTDGEVPSGETPSRMNVWVVSQLLPVGIPLLVLFLGRQIAKEQVAIAWLAVTASFLCSAARLILTNREQRSITDELRQAEIALRRSENLFSTAFRSSADAFGVSSLADGRFIEVNDGFVRLTGYAREEALGKSPVEMNLWVDTGHRARVMATLAEQGKVWEEEFKLRRKSGEIRVGQFTAAVVVLEGQRCALVTVRDITARKDAEEMLRTNEERFRSLVENLHVGIVSYGPDRTVQFANRAALDPLGMTEPQVRGRTISELGLTALREDGTEIPTALRPVSRAMETRQPVRNQVIGWRHADSDDVTWTLVDAVPEYTENGDLIRVLLSLTDITERRKAEEALRENEEQFRTLVKNIHVGILAGGADLRIRFVNQALLDMFGLTEEQVLGRTAEEIGLMAFDEAGRLIPFPDRPGPRSLAARQPIRSQIIRWRVPGSNKLIWTLMDAVPLYSEKNELIRGIVSFTDLTKRKEAEESLHQLSTRLLELQDEERRRIGRELHDGLAQSVLAVNLNLAQLTQSPVVLDERSRRALAEARSLLLEMSRDIRTLSYLLHPPLLDELGLASAVREYAEGFSERGGISVEVDIQADFERLPQEAETALFRIVQESLSNIQRHSGSSTARIVLHRNSTGVTLEVSDQGHGMAGVEADEGTGGRRRFGVGILGMRERMTQLGGNLEIQSSASGTTVKATISSRSEITNAAAHPDRG